MTTTINHILLRTKNLNKMVDFFIQVLELKKGYRPPFEFPGAWLWSGNKPLIHLSEINLTDNRQTEYLGAQNNSTDTGTGIIEHIAFSGLDYPSLIERLKNEKLKFFERTIPVNEEHQVFIDGPEGLKVEIQFENKYDNQELNISS